MRSGTAEVPAQEFQCPLMRLCSMATACGAAASSPAGQLVAAHRKVERGEALFRSGDPFTSLYAINTGFFKTAVFAQNGRGQITGFEMAGDLLGLDAVASGRHTCDAIALEPSQVCTLPFDRISVAGRGTQVLHDQLYLLMGREIVRDQRMMLVLGSMTAQERVASFISDLADRRDARGWPRGEFVLAMTRGDIGNHLGLTFETVSRALSHLAARGLIHIKSRRIEVLDTTALRSGAGATMTRGKPCAVSGGRQG